MTWLVYLSILAWGFLLFYSAAGAWRVIAGKGTDHDPTKLGFSLVAIYILLFNGKRLVIPDSVMVADALRGAGIIIALYLIAIVRFYKR